MSNSLLSVRDLHVHFPIAPDWIGRPTGWLKAVDGVGLDIAEGESLALVGESGCGKSTLGAAILGMQPRTSGRIIFDGNDLQDDTARMRAERSRDIQIVFQDPVSALNPRMAIGRSIAEIGRAHV